MLQCQRVGLNMTMGCGGAALIPDLYFEVHDQNAGRSFGWGFICLFYLMPFMVYGSEMGILSPGWFRLGPQQVSQLHARKNESHVKDPFHHFARMHQVINCWSPLVWCVWRCWRGEALSPFCRHQVHAMVESQNTKQATLLNRQHLRVSGILDPVRTKQLSLLAVCRRDHGMVTV